MTTSRTGCFPAPDSGGGIDPPQEDSYPGSISRQKPTSFTSTPYDKKEYSPIFAIEVGQLGECVVSHAEYGRILTESRTPVAWTLLDEAALRRQIGGPAVMAEQLRKIADMADAGRLRLHVLTLAAGAHALLESMVYLLDFPDAAPVAYVEGLLTRNLMDEPALVESCRTAYSLALSHAASHRESVTLVRAIAEEHQHAHESQRH
ncbi:DUF5753 domain-containing protein [Streptomyces sp. NPDC014744]|uniref:DUF5753 domain-containing protein n=1 Tax=Streptomyces sp. NPDC014744 TaxID=3364903 RepID=UPI0036FB6B62